MKNYLQFSIKRLSYFCFLLFFSSAFAQQVEESSASDLQTDSQALSLSAKQDLKKPVVLQDLAYGNILFDYYRGNFVESLTAILVAEKRKTLPNHELNARLLSGVIYLDLGMLEHAQNIFNQLLTEEDLKSELLSKIEFYLSKLHYRQGDYNKSIFRLTRIVDVLETRLKDDSYIMLSNMAIFADKKEEAKMWLSKVSADSELSAISQYNLGILWLREANLAQAAPLLENIHPEFTEDKVIKALQDKAFVALGYYSLSQKNYLQAREYLFKVRLKSPQSNKALLGVGWSYSGEGNYKRALSHWIELSKRDIRDLAVQESLIAIPYAYQRLNSMQASLKNYVFASDTFQSQIDLINELVNKMDYEDLLEKFVTNIVTNEFEGLADKEGIQNANIFGKKYDYYLYELISEHEFNEGFKNYQKLGQLSKILDRWEASLPTFSDIIHANKVRFSEKIPVVDEYLQEDSFAQFEQALAGYQDDLKALKNDQKFYLLANKKQLKLHNRLKALWEKINKLPEGTLSKEQLETAKRASGILQWQLESNKAAKIWALEKNIIQIQSVLSEMFKRKATLSDARQHASIRFAGAQEKVDAATQSLLGLREKIQWQIDAQSKELKALIRKVLRQRKATLNQYLLQSDLSIARLHEKAIKIPEPE